MNTGEGLGLSSLEQQKQLAKVLADTKELMRQEEALIGKVLKGEENLGKIRVSYLTQYNDEYSRLLNDVSEQSKALKNDFISLSKQLSETSKKLDSTKSNKTDKTASGLESEKHKKQSSTSQGTSQKLTKDLTIAVRDLTTVVSELRKVATSRYGAEFVATTDSGRSTSKTGRTGSGGPGSGGPGSRTDTTSAGGVGGSGAAVRVGSSIDKATRSSLKDPELSDILSIFGKVPQELEIKNFATESNKTNLKDLETNAAKTYNSIKKLELARLQTIEDSDLTRAQLLIKQEQEETRSAEIRLAKLTETTDKELEVQTYLNNKIAELKLASATNIGDENYNEAGELRARKVNAAEELKIAEALETKRIKWIEKQELESKRKNNGILTKEEATRIQKEAATKFKFDKDNLGKLAKERTKLVGAKAHAAERAEMRSELNIMRTAETFEERKQALYNLTHNEAGEVDHAKALSAAILAISDLAKKLENKVDEIGKYKGAIDTRLQGSSGSTRKSWKSGSYWDNLTDAMMSVGAITPFFKQETFANNIKALVDKGISFDLKQRAFLMTIQEKIANTFNVADGTLLRLIRIQQEDSTAGRLGMESALNSFLNEMYETSEYLSDVAASVRGSLEEMEALMAGAAATEVEYQVQKWMGSLYSVGMSQNAVTAISNALGQVASGQVDALTSGGAGNLLVMAANNAGIPIADILTNGLDAKETNKLLQATVDYLAEIAESSKGNNIVQQQLASVFGVKASDLRAATSLVAKGTTNDIFKENKSYDNMIKQLRNMADTMFMRTSVGEFMTNIWENAQYSIAGSMASNPISYLTYKLAGLLDSAVGGIDLPFINVMGFGVDLNTTVSDLMRVAAVGTGLLNSLGPMINGLASSFSGSMMLNSMGISQGSGLKVTQRGGDGIGALDNNGGAPSTSGSGYVGNASSSDVKNATLQEAEASKKKQMIEAKEEEPSNQVDVLNTYVLKIYEMLDEVVSGNKSFRVRVDNYGLTGGLKSPGSSAQAGIGGLLNNSNTASGVGNGTISSGTVGGGAIGSTGGNLSSNSSLGTAVDLGGWTTL